MAKSGKRPVHQNTNDTDKYVEIANTSQRSGELKLTHNDPNWFGIGNTLASPNLAHPSMPFWLSAAHLRWICLQAWSPGDEVYIDSVFSTAYQLPQPL